MAAAAYDIITIAQAKAYLQIGQVTADTTQDVWLQEILSDISLGIEDYIKNKVASQDVSNEIYDGDGDSISEDRQTIYTKFFPIIQLSTASTPSDAQKLAAVQYRNDPDSSWTDIETDVDHIFIDTLDWTYIELYDQVFPAGRRNIRLSYKAGHATIPGDIKNVCLEMVVMMLKESNRGPGLAQLGKASKTASALGVTFTEGLLDLDPKWKRVLDRYRVPTV